MARCTCTGQPPGAGDTTARAGLEASATADAPAAASAADPFEDWDSPPDGEALTWALLDHAADRFGLVETDNYLGHGVMDANCENGAVTLAVLGVARLDPATETAARQAGLVETFEVADDDLTETLWVADGGGPIPKGVYDRSTIEVIVARGAPRDHLLAELGQG